MRIYIAAFLIIQSFVPLTACFSQQIYFPNPSFDSEISIKDFLELEPKDQVSIVQRRIFKFYQEGKTLKLKHPAVKYVQIIKLFLVENPQYLKADFETTFNYILVEDRSLIN